MIRFVAQIRALLSEQPDLLDPIAAEHQLRSALGEKIATYRDHTQDRTPAGLGPRERAHPDLTHSVTL